MDVKYTENLLKALLRRRENSADTVEELNEYVTDLKNGELLESDARYIAALAKRLGVTAGSGVAPEGAGSGPDTSEPDAAEPEAIEPDPSDDYAPDPGVADAEAPLIDVPEGSFLEHARTTARATMERHWQDSGADPVAVRDFISHQLDGLAERLEEEILNDARGVGILPVPTGHLRMALLRDNETPALFTNGNERDLETTPGYIKLAATCEDLLLRLKFETGHEEGYTEPEEPPVYLVDVVISGWV